MSRSHRGSSSHTSTSMPTVAQEQIYRSACDRCHGHKLRCLRESTGICDRCRRAGTRCTTSPPRRMGRPLGSKTGKPSISARGREEVDISEMRNDPLYDQIPMHNTASGYGDQTWLDTGLLYHDEDGPFSECYQAGGLTPRGDADQGIHQHNQGGGSFLGATMSTTLNPWMNPSSAHIPEHTSWQFGHDSISMQSYEPSWASNPISSPLPQPSPQPSRQSLRVFPHDYNASSGFNPTYPTPHGQELGHSTEGRLSHESDELNFTYSQSHQYQTLSEVLPRSSPNNEFSGSYVQSRNIPSHQIPYLGQDELQPSPPQFGGPISQSQGRLHIPQFSRLNQSLPPRLRRF